MTSGCKGIHCGIEKQNFVSKNFDSARYDVLLRHITSPEICSPFKRLNWVRRNASKVNNINTTTNGWIFNFQLDHQVHFDRDRLSEIGELTRYQNSFILDCHWMEMNILQIMAVLHEFGLRGMINVQYSNEWERDKCRLNIRLRTLIKTILKDNDNERQEM